MVTKIVFNIEDDALILTMSDGYITINKVSTDNARVEIRYADDEKIPVYNEKSTISLVRIAHELVKAMKDVIEFLLSDHKVTSSYFEFKEIVIENVDDTEKRIMKASVITDEGVIETVISVHPTVATLIDEMLSNIPDYILTDGVEAAGIYYHLEKCIDNIGKCKIVERYNDEFQMLYGTYKIDDTELDITINEDKIYYRYNDGEVRSISDISVTKLVDSLDRLRSSVTDYVLNTLDRWSRNTELDEGSSLNTTGVTDTVLTVVSDKGNLTIINTVLKLPYSDKHYSQLVIHNKAVMIKREEILTILKKIGELLRL